MKSQIMAELLRQIKSKPHLKRKLKIFLGVGVVGLLLVTALTVYLGVVGAKYVASLGSNVDVARHAKTLKSTAESVTPVGVVGCLGAAQSLLNLEKLFLTPVEDSFRMLKRACLDGLIPSPDAGKESELI